MSTPTRRLWSAREDGPAETDPVPPLKGRADVLAEGAEAARRGADALVEGEHGRARTVAGLAAGAGGLAIVLACLAALGHGDPRILIILSGLAALAPTALAMQRATDSEPRLRDIAVDRGAAQALAVQARRLGDSVGARDEHNIPLTAQGVIHGQVDLLFRDLDRLQKRLGTSGAPAGRRAAADQRPGRLVPDATETMLCAADGRRYPVFVVEMTPAAVVVRGNLPPLTRADTVQVGARRARAVELGAGRATLQFVTPIVPSEFNRRIVL